MALSFSALSEIPIAAAVTSVSASAFLGSVTGVSNAGTLLYDAKAITTSSSASAAFTVNSFSDVDAKANISIPSVSATVVNSFKGIANTTTLSSATATTINNTFDDVDAQANVVTSAASAVFTAGVLDYIAKANITLDTVTADADLTINASDFADEDAQATISLTGVTCTGFANFGSVTSVEVVFANTDFDRSRLVNIVPYGNHTIYVT